jgi:hypothetical protein
VGRILPATLPAATSGPCLCLRPGGLAAQPNRLDVFVVQHQPGAVSQVVGRLLVGAVAARLGTPRRRHRLLTHPTPGGLVAQKDLR